MVPGAKLPGPAERGGMAGFALSGLGELSLAMAGKTDLSKVFHAKPGLAEPCLVELPGMAELSCLAKLPVLAALGLAELPGPAKLPGLADVSGLAQLPGLAKLSGPERGKLRARLVSSSDLPVRPCALQAAGIARAEACSEAASWPTKSLLETHFVTRVRLEAGFEIGESAG
mmetsp:Transcript_8455/g.15000  ORF Transcript_8455/g.15000 Transcript_8455/m.15000 type:complete len:172 (+) Transcript_8455:199-714(+)